jgi:hypothetical protein
MARLVPTTPPPTDLSTADGSEEDVRGRIDSILGRVAVHGLDGLTWRDWDFLKQTSRQWRKRGRSASDRYA